jgi:3,4-dihydroxy 2-butanone 4-phosphate synthase/GTP cyclohydrolase II
MPKNNFASIESIINVAKKGGMFILVDDEKRENEGDLIISTSNSNAKNINFMAKVWSRPNLFGARLCSG